MMSVTLSNVVRVVRWTPVGAAVNDTLVAQPARMTLAYRGAVGSASTGE
jgi:hypothetical protein